MSKKIREQTLPQPERHQNIPESAQWLAGEGAGSWFYIHRLPSQQYEITRYAPNGIVECTGVFENTSYYILLMNRPFKFVHLSHCQKVTIEQGPSIITFERSVDSI